MTSPDERAGTLKKIDEIEAQMSQQWWKGKEQGAPAPQTASQQGAAPESQRMVVAPPIVPPRPAVVLAAQAALGDQVHAFAPTAPMSMPASLGQGGFAGSASGRRRDGSRGALARGRCRAVRA